MQLHVALHAPSNPRNDVVTLPVILHSGADASSSGRPFSISFFLRIIFHLSYFLGLVGSHILGSYSFRLCRYLICTLASTNTSLVLLFSLTGRCPFSLAYRCALLHPLTASADEGLSQLRSSNPSLPSCRKYQALPACRPLAS